MQIKKSKNFIEYIGHFDNEILCAKLTLLADLYAIEHKVGYAKFDIKDEDKLNLVNDKLDYLIEPEPSEPTDTYNLIGTTWQFNYDLDYSFFESFGYGTYTFYINFYCDNNEDLNNEYISLDAYKDEEVLLLNGGSELEDGILLYYSNLGEVYDRYDVNGNMTQSDWSYPEFRTIIITGGTDIDSSSFYAFLTSNATQQGVSTPNTYSLTHNLTNLTKGNVTLQITPDMGYMYPSSVTVNNGTLVSYDNTNGTLVVNGGDSMSISCECPESTIEPYLTFETDDGSEFTLGSDYSDYAGGYVLNPDGILEYSTDTINWTTWNTMSSTPISSLNGKLYLRGSNNTVLSTYVSCFLEGTNITLANGTTKKVEDIRYDDDLLVWDFDNGEYSSAKPCWITRSGLKNNHYYRLTFSDGTILETTGVHSNHRIYNIDQQKFVGVSSTVAGDRVFTQNGIVSVVSNEYINDTVSYYNLITSTTFDCFANGVLTSDRYGNMYEIDSNMKFIKDGREIRPYSNYEAVGISRYWYDNLRLGEQTESIEKSAEYVNKCESQMLARRDT